MHLYICSLFWNNIAFTVSNFEVLTVRSWNLKPVHSDGPWIYLNHLGPCEIWWNISSSRLSPPVVVNDLSNVFRFSPPKTHTPCRFRKVPGFWSSIWYNEITGFTTQDKRWPKNLAFWPIMQKSHSMQFQPIWNIGKKNGESSGRSGQRNESNTIRDLICSRFGPRMYTVHKFVFYGHQRINNGTFRKQHFPQKNHNIFSIYLLLIPPIRKGI